MMGWRVSDGGIGVGSLPGEDGSAIDDQIACTNQAATDGNEHHEDEETFMNGSACRRRALALLGGAGNAKPSPPDHMVTRMPRPRQAKLATSHAYLERRVVTASVGARSTTRTPHRRCVALLLDRQARTADSGGGPNAQPADTGQANAAGKQASRHRYAKQGSAELVLGGTMGAGLVPGYSDW